MAKNEENFLQKITLTIEQTTKHIKRLETLDDNQTLHIFSIIDFAYNPKLDKAFFKFNATEHSGVEIIDMRWGKEDKGTSSYKSYPPCKKIFSTTFGNFNTLTKNPLLLVKAKH